MLGVIENPGDSLAAIFTRASSQHGCVWLTPPAFEELGVSGRVCLCSRSDPAGVVRAPQGDGRAQAGSLCVLDAVEGRTRLVGFETCMLRAVDQVECHATYVRRSVLASSFMLRCLLVSPEEVFPFSAGFPTWIYVPRVSLREVSCDSEPRSPALPAGGLDLAVHVLPTRVQCQDARDYAVALPEYRDRVDFVAQTAYVHPRPEEASMWGPSERTGCPGCVWVAPSALMQQIDGVLSVWEVRQWSVALSFDGFCDTATEEEALVFALHFRVRQWQVAGKLRNVRVRGTLDSRSSSSSSGSSPCGWGSLDLSEFDPLGRRAFRRAHPGSSLESER